MWSVMLRTLLKGKHLNELIQEHRQVPYLKKEVKESLFVLKVKSSPEFFIVITWCNWFCTWLLTEYTAPKNILIVHGNSFLGEGTAKNSVFLQNSRYTLSYQFNILASAVIMGQIKIVEMVKEKKKLDSYWVRWGKISRLVGYMRPRCYAKWNFGVISTLASNCCSMDTHFSHVNKESGESEGKTGTLLTAAIIFYYDPEWL